MHHLNEVNGADKITLRHAGECLKDFEGHIYGVEMGIAYGGGVEAIGHMWKDRGTIYGYDTFEDLHPEQLSEDKDSFEARCMDHWYNTKGVDQLSYDYQRAQLDGQGLDNVILVKGLVNKQSCKDIPYLNYAFLDMDIYESMKQGWLAVKDKIVKNGYFLLHDIIPQPHLPKLYKLWKEEIMTDPYNKWEILEEVPESHLTVMRKV